MLGFNALVLLWLLSGNVAFSVLTPCCFKLQAIETKAKRRKRKWEKVNEVDVQESIDATQSKGGDEKSIDMVQGCNVS
jgi:hypothetical protein